MAAVIVDPNNFLKLQRYGEGVYGKDLFIPLAYRPGNRTSRILGVSMERAREEDPELFRVNLNGFSKLGESFDILFVNNELECDILRFKVLASESGDERIIYEKKSDTWEEMGYEEFKSRALFENFILINDYAMVKLHIANLLKMRELEQRFDFEWEDVKIRIMHELEEH